MVARMESLAARLKDPRAWAREAAFAVALGVFFALIGPFGSYDEPLPRRFAVCLAYSFAGLPFWGPGFRAALWFGERLRAPPFLARLAAVLLVTVPITGMVRLVSRLFYADAVPPSLVSVYLSVNTIAVPLALVLGLIAARNARHSTPPASAVPQPPRLALRLPAAIEGPILALQAEDHYVRVHTTRGSTLLLMRFADAMAELDGLPGLQVHRSWWVARAAVAGAAKSGRRAELALTNGLSVPISRAAMPEARAAGYLGVRA